MQQWKRKPGRKPNVGQKLVHLYLKILHRVQTQSMV